MMRGGREQRVGIQVEDRLGIGLIAGARIVAPQRQHVAHALCGGADQQTLQRDAIAVAAGELQHRLDAGALPA